jgi:ornithine cyclodeaminase
LVFDRNTGAHLALLDGAVLTARRTAAATALGARHLSTKDASRLLLLGSGKVASLVPEALKAVRPIKEVRVWDRYIESAEKLVESLNSEGWNAEVAYDLPEAVPQADIISAATLATEPILEGRWLRDGQHVDLIGAFTPLMREADDLALQRARIYVDTSFALSESGELKTPLETGVITKDDIQGDLNSIATGKVSRGSQNEITLFKSVGNALMDLAAASFFTK